MVTLLSNLRHLSDNVATSWQLGKSDRPGLCWTAFECCQPEKIFCGMALLCETSAGFGRRFGIRNTNAICTHEESLLEIFWKMLSGKCWDIQQQIQTTSRFLCKNLETVLWVTMVCLQCSIAEVTPWFSDCDLLTSVPFHVASASRNWLQWYRMQWYSQWMQGSITKNFQITVILLNPSKYFLPRITSIKKPYWFSKYWNYLGMLFNIFHEVCQGMWAKSLPKNPATKLLHLKRGRLRIDLKGTWNHPWYQINIWMRKKKLIASIIFYVSRYSWNWLVLFWRFNHFDPHRHLLLAELLTTWLPS